MKTPGVLATAFCCLIVGGLVGYNFATTPITTATSEMPQPQPQPQPQPVKKQEVKPQPKPKYEVYSYDIDDIAQRRHKNELKLKDELKRGWMRFTMTVDRIQCETDSDCYAVSKEGGMGFSLRPHNTKSEDLQWLKDYDVGSTIDLVCSRYVDQNLYYDMRDCIPFDQLSPELINVHKQGD